MTDIALHRMKRIWLSPVLESAARAVAAWRERARGRAELARMTPRELDDIGLSRTERWTEINKPFWRA